MAALKFQAKIYLLRHGETLWNAEMRFQGRMDSPLTEKGKQQAAAVGQILVGIFGTTCPYSLYVSPQGRTRETAAIIQQSLSFRETIIEPRLREVSMGDWEGLTRDEVLKRWPQCASDLKNNRAFLCAPNGEPYDAFVAQLTSWLNELTEPVIAVSHGMTGRLIRSVYEGLALDEALSFSSAQGSIWHLKDGKSELLRLNAVEEA
jgi:probable phosphoglycerate mutase